MSKKAWAGIVAVCVPVLVRGGGGGEACGGGGIGVCHTPSIAFRHPPPNSARFIYATEEPLFISAQLSSDAVSALRKVRVLI